MNFEEKKELKNRGCRGYHFRICWLQTKRDLRIFPANVGVNFDKLLSTHDMIVLFAEIFFVTEPTTLQRSMTRFIEMTIFFQFKKEKKWVAKIPKNLIK